MNKHGYILHTHNKYVVRAPSDPAVRAPLNTELLCCRHMLCYEQPHNAHTWLEKRLIREKQFDHWRHLLHRLSCVPFVQESINVPDIASKWDLPLHGICLLGRSYSCRRWRHRRHPFSFGNFKHVFTPSLYTTGNSAVSPTEFSGLCYFPKYIFTILMLGMK